MRQRITKPKNLISVPPPAKSETYYIHNDGDSSVGIWPTNCRITVIVNPPTEFDVELDKQFRELFTEYFINGPGGFGFVQNEHEYLTTCPDCNGRKSIKSSVCKKCYRNRAL